MSYGFAGTVLRQLVGRRELEKKKVSRRGASALVCFLRPTLSTPIAA